MFKSIKVKVKPPQPPQPPQYTFIIDIIEICQKIKEIYDKNNKNIIFINFIKKCILIINENIKNSDEKTIISNINYIYNSLIKIGLYISLQKVENDINNFSNSLNMDTDNMGTLIKFLQDTFPSNALKYQIYPSNIIIDKNELKRLLGNICICEERNQPSCTLAKSENGIKVSSNIFVESKLIVSFSDLYEKIKKIFEKEYSKNLKSKYKELVKNKIIKMYIAKIIHYLTNTNEDPKIIYHKIYFIYNKLANLFLTDHDINYLKELLLNNKDKNIDKIINYDKSIFPFPIIKQNINVKNNKNNKKLLTNVLNTPNIILPELSLDIINSYKKQKLIIMKDKINIQQIIMLLKTIFINNISIIERPINEIIRIFNTNIEEYYNINLFEETELTIPILNIELLQCIKQMNNNVQPFNFKILNILQIINNDKYHNLFVSIENLITKINPDYSYLINQEITINVFPQIFNTIIRCKWTVFFKDDFLQPPEENYDLFIPLNYTNYQEIDIEYGIEIEQIRSIIMKNIILKLESDNFVLPHLFIFNLIKYNVPDIKTKINEFVILYHQSMIHKKNLNNEIQILNKEMQKMKINHLSNKNKRNKETNKNKKKELSLIINGKIQNIKNLEFKILGLKQHKNKSFQNFLITRF